MQVQLDGAWRDVLQMLRVADEVTCAVAHCRIESFVIPFPRHCSAVQSVVFVDQGHVRRGANTAQAVRK